MLWHNCSCCSGSIFFSVIATPFSEQTAPTHLAINLNPSHPGFNRTKRQRGRCLPYGTKTLGNARKFSFHFQRGAVGWKQGPKSTQSPFACVEHVPGCPCLAQLTQIEKASNCVTGHCYEPSSTPAFFDKHIFCCRVLFHAHVRAQRFRHLCVGGWDVRQWAA